MLIRVASDGLNDNRAPRLKRAAHAIGFQQIA
jgi:hypothetical protein